MPHPTTAAEVQGDRRGKAGAVAGFILFLILLLIPLFFTTLPKPGQPGILVNLGQIDIGQGSENAGPAAPAKPEPAEEKTPTPPKEEVTPPPVAPPPPPSAKPEPTAVVKDVVVTETPQEIAIRKQKARDEARKKAEADQKRKAQAEADRKAREETDRQNRIEQERIRKQREAEQARKAAAEAAAAKKAAEEAAAREAQRKADARRESAGGLFGGGGGRGETGKPGNQGVENGDPNAGKLTGISTGKGQVSGGLGGRGVVSSPPVSERSQRPGKVAIRVCVDPSGKIISADFQQGGSTTNDPNLISAARNNAKTWRFKADALAASSQCGTITYDFRVQ